MHKILITYYSHSGNTRFIAEKIQKLSGGDLFEIQPVKAYPKEYNDVVKLARKEKQENSTPELKEKVRNIENYDVVFVGTPVWWYTMATPIKSFMRENNLADKTIAPFCTHGGGGESSTYIDMEKSAPNSKILKGLTVYGNGGSNTEKDIKNWLIEIGVL